MLKPSRIFFFLTTFILINLNNCFASDADVLFDWAEGQYPQLFAPSPSPTLTDLQDWEYRIYNETGTAIGIEKGQKIYVTGGSFGTFMEDIIFVLENRENFILDLMNCSKELKLYFCKQEKSLLNDEFLNVLSKVTHV